MPLIKKHLKVMPSVSSVCQHPLSWAGMCLVLCVSLWGARRYLCWKLTPVWAFEPSDVKSLMILLSHWMVKTNLALVETSKQRAGWGGRADPSTSSKSRSWESPAALGMLSYVESLSCSASGRLLKQQGRAVDCDCHLWIVSDSADYNGFI